MAGSMPSSPDPDRNGHMILERIDALPSPRAAAVATTFKVYADEVAASGKVTMSQLESAGAFGRKTILKHIRAGVLPAEKAAVNGKTMWLFEPIAVEAYLASAADLLEEAVHYKKNRPTRVEAPAGFLSIMAAAEQCAVSHWTLREHLAETGVGTVLGRHAAKMIAEKDLPKLQAYFARMIRPRSRRAEPRPPAKGRLAGGPYFDTFETMWAVMREQPEIDAEEIARVTGAVIKTARRWVAGARVPAGEYQWALIALFRERFLCRVSPLLKGEADEHRRIYMRRYMRDARKKDET